MEDHAVVCQVHGQMEEDEECTGIDMSTVSINIFTSKFLPRDRYNEV